MNTFPASSILEPNPPAGFADAWPAFRKGPGRAADLQRTLVPVVAYRDARIEAYGKSNPKDAVGGDLADLITGGGDVVACVADVSGHGLRATLLMGMIKTALRFGLHSGQPLARVLDHMNVVLPAVKEPSMFATFAALRFDGSREAEYVSAGHVPLLHYRSRTRDVVRYSMTQFPVGLFAGPAYATSRIPYEEGDLFGLVTDGVVEAGDERDAESGFERVAGILRQLAGYPLPDMYEAVQGSAAAQGEQHDDQTVLLVRALGRARGWSPVQEMPGPASSGDSGWSA